MRLSLEIFNREFALDVTSSWLTVTLGKYEVALMLNNRILSKAPVCHKEVGGGFMNTEFAWNRGSLILSCPA